MTIAITTPTGNIGAALTARLLDAGEDLVLLARKPEKLRDFASRGAKIIKGNLEDRDYVVEATRGVSAFFWLTPPNLAAEDFRAYQDRLGRNAAEAVKANAIPHVVNVSSIGAHHDGGVGFINGLHDVEQHLDGAARNIVHLRPAFFFENYLQHLDTMQQAGSVFMPAPGSVRLPMLATRDIAQAAAGLLLDLSWTGRSVRGLHGPADHSFDEAAAILSDVLGRKISHVAASPDQVRETFASMGLPRKTADLLIEMHRAFETGYLQEGAEPRTPETTTETTLEAFARETIRPLLRPSAKTPAAEEHVHAI